MLDHVESHGYVVSKPTTSKECTWSKGKKRDKDPKRLSSKNYPSKQRKCMMTVADFDPRPAMYRKVKPAHINGLLRDLQNISTQKKESSMWESQIRLTYEDYELCDVDVNNSNDKVNILVESLKPTELMQILGAEEQSKSQEWFSQRWKRLTASKCLAACRVGRLIISGAPNAALRAFKFIKDSIWKIYHSLWQSYWIKYGLESEPKAIRKYELETNCHVSSSGL